MHGRVRQKAAFHADFPRIQKGARWDNTPQYNYANAVYYIIIAKSRCQHFFSHPLHSFRKASVIILSGVQKQDARFRVLFSYFNII